MTDTAELKRTKIRRGHYRLGDYEIVHMVGNVWEIYEGSWDECNHIATEFTLEEACAAIRGWQPAKEKAAS